jgi:hypothetical protein
MLKTKKFWIPVAVLTVISLTMSAQPALAVSPFDNELNEAATQHAHNAYGTTAALGLWTKDSQTLVAVTPEAAAALDKTLPTSDTEINKLITTNTNLLAGFVTNVTGYDPRIPDQMVHLQGALEDYWTLLNTQRFGGGTERDAFATLEYRNYRLIGGHDEFRRRLLGYRCTNCARQLALTALGGGGGVIYNTAVNGSNISAIMNASVGAGIGFVIATINILLDNQKAYNEQRVASLNRDTRVALSYQTTLALIAAREALAASRLNAAEAGQRLNLLENAYASTSTFTGRIRWLIRGHQ